MNTNSSYTKDNTKNIIYLVTTSAGKDISNSVGISWHCKHKGSYLVYYKAGSNILNKVIPNEHYWSIEESYIDTDYINKRYVCTVDLINLEHGSKYFYKIISNNISTFEFSFTTSNNQTYKYSFLAFADFQYSENQTSLNLANKLIKENPNTNLITCSGDVADEGNYEKSHRFLFDSEVFSNHILAFGCGDHEYWGSLKSPIKMLKKPYAYNKLFNNPKNGCNNYLNSSYYFKNNTSIFVFLDCGDSNVSYTDEMFTEQAKWLDNVLTTEKETKFIIIFAHKSFYGDPQQDCMVGKIAPILIKIFDKHQVDLVISGHDHEYSRTKPLYKNDITEGGTIYLDLGSSGNKVRHTGEQIKNSNLYDKYLDLKDLNYALGLIGEIDDKNISITIKNQYLNVVDIFNIDKKNRNI